MSRIKVIIAGVIFIAVTILKFAMPTLALEMRGYIQPAIDNDFDYKSAMVILGEKITGENGVITAIARAYGNIGFGGAPEEEEPESGVNTGHSFSHLPEIIARMEEPASSGYDISFHTATAGPEDAQETQDIQETPISGSMSEEIPTEAPTEIPPETEPPPEWEPPVSVEATPDVVEAFLASQAAFKDEEIPDNVSVTMPGLPFAYTSPVVGYSSSGFGFRVHPLTSTVKFHYGTDIAAYTGTPVSAFADGTVTVAGESDSYGKYIIINHSDGYSTLYAHCSKLLVGSGSYVEKGQTIAEVGETGQATGPHLHFELMCNSVYYNPEFYINSV